MGIPRGDVLGRMITATSALWSTPWTISMSRGEKKNIVSWQIKSHIELMDTYEGGPMA